ncbi:MAG TPA: DNA double-strand break repair nuclease NurA [Anaerolineales bacterium]|nr:DNA double-strand break repair nuclease NurA [Anaerolineales bacterium]
MPINYQEIYTQIKQVGLGAKERRKRKEEAQEQAQKLLERYSSELDFLRSKVDSAKAADANIRCAVPLDEELASSHPLPDSVSQATLTPGVATLIAADGSQIVPNRHDALQYYVINVGAIAMQIGSGNTPEVETDTELRVLDEFDDTFFSEGQVALQRDVAERKKLLEMAENYSGTIIALTEGQLELWGSVDNENAREFEKSLQDYLNVLEQLHRKNIIAGGYVDKPGANWFVKLLEIASTPADELKNVRKNRLLAGVTDLWLFSQILGEHERSAVFALQAKSAEKYKGALAIHFFYSNVGDKKHPKIARVDVPLWVAENPSMLNTLHAVLVEQSKIMGKAPFPYLLPTVKKKRLIDCFPETSFPTAANWAKSLANSPRRIPREESEDNVVARRSEATTKQSPDNGEAASQKPLAAT